MQRLNVLHVLVVLALRPGRAFRCKCNAPFAAGKRQRHSKPPAGPTFGGGAVIAGGHVAGSHCGSEATVRACHRQREECEEAKKRVMLAATACCRLLVRLRRYWQHVRCECGVCGGFRGPSRPDALGHRPQRPQRGCMASHEVHADSPFCCRFSRAQTNLQEQWLKPRAGKAACTLLNNVWAPKGGLCWQAIGCSKGTAAMLKA